MKFMMAAKDFGPDSLPSDPVPSAVGVPVQGPSSLCGLALKRLSSWAPAEACDRVHVVFVFWSRSCYLEHRDVTPALITGKLSLCPLWLSFFKKKLKKPYD